MRTPSGTPASSARDRGAQQYFMAGEPGPIFGDPSPSFRDCWSGVRHLTTGHTVLPNARNTGKTRYQRGKHMYSQKAQVAIMQVDGAPKVLPKEPTERLKLVATAVDAITEPP